MIQRVIVQGSFGITGRIGPDGPERAAVRKGHHHLRTPTGRIGLLERRVGLDRDPAQPIARDLVLGVEGVERGQAGRAVRQALRNAVLHAELRGVGRGRPRPIRYVEGCGIGADLDRGDTIGGEVALDRSPEGAAKLESGVDGGVRVATARIRLHGRLRELPTRRLGGDRFGNRIRAKRPEEALPPLQNLGGAGEAPGRQERGSQSRRGRAAGMKGVSTCWRPR